MDGFSLRRPSENVWDEAYPLLPAQYAELSRRSEHTQPERRLLLAVLSDAIALFQGGASRPASPTRGDFEEARRWILSNDRVWPFSFVNVCEALGIASGPLRQALIAARCRAHVAPLRPAARRRLLAGVVAETWARTG